MNWAFWVSFIDNQTSLGKILSRKKQLVPMLEEFFSR
jgi:inorganic pyrophosphatase/exopolyphosphatase